jgi:hypothetical protein
LNVTVPLGVPPVPVTVAVKVTVCPAVDGFALEVSAVDDVVFALTVWLTLPLLVAKVVSPL